MILRNVVYAEPRPLRAGVAQPVLVVAKPTTVETASKDIGGHSPNAQVEALTAERVMRWLDDQDIQTRERIAATLAAELDELRDRASVEGMEIGKQAAHHEVEERFQTALTTLRSLAAQADEVFNAHRREVAGSCIHIVGEVLTKLVGEAIVKPEATLAAVNQAIGRICGAREVIVRVNSRDLDAIESKRAEIAEMLGATSFSIVADQRVQSGGCLLESSFGDIDARWETQLPAVVGLLRSEITESESLL